VACPSRESLSGRATAKRDTVLIDAPPNTQQRPDLQQAAAEVEVSSPTLSPRETRKRKVTNIRMVVSKLYSLKSVLTPPSTRCRPCTVPSRKQLGAGGDGSDVGDEDDMICDQANVSRNTSI
jgi:hypothetical protein